MFDRDLATLYNVTTKALNQGVRRNPDRFPEDFGFQLTAEELEDWRSQIVTSNPAAGKGLRYRPWVFTEHGVVMLSAVLRSDRAVAISIALVRAFVRLRQLALEHVGLSHRMDAVEMQIEEHEDRLDTVFATLTHLMTPPADDAERRRIGFTVGGSE